MVLAGCQLPGSGGGRVGSAAKQLLDPREHAKLVVEIDYPVGYGPNAQAKQVLKDALVQVTGRDASQVEFVEEAEIPAEAGKKYTLNEIVALEDEHRDRKTGGDTAALYVLYVAGGSTDDGGDSRVLGLAYRGTSIAMMKGNIKDASKSGLLSTRPDEQCVERSVLVHEFGHAAGLVNLGAPMVSPHEDGGHPGHSSNKESVMYYAVENTVDLLSLFTGGCSDIPYRYDGNDLADLSALRNS